MFINFTILRNKTSLALHALRAYDFYYEAVFTRSDFFFPISGNSIPGRPTSHSPWTITSGMSFHAVDGNIASCFTMKRQKVRKRNKFLLSQMRLDLSVIELLRLSVLMANREIWFSSFYLRSWQFSGLC